MMDKEFLTPTDLEAAGIAKRATLATWRSKSKGPRWLKLNGGAIRYRRSEVDEWLNVCARGTSSASAQPHQ